MSKLAEKFNVDLTDLQNLLEGVVAFVEVRTDSEDISYDIAREMKEIGATISENRNSKVTHVIFRNGTLRTSNWAKKKDIPLIDIGWLAACTKYKVKFLSRPWHVPYLTETVNIFGEKKRMRYKKYFKNMNLEEFERDTKRRDERRKKRLEKSLNNSKSDGSFNGEPNKYLDTSEYDQIKPLKTPAIVKRFAERLERYKKTGRYSWETPSSGSDSEKEEHADDDSEPEKLCENDNQVEENRDNNKENLKEKESTEIKLNDINRSHNSYNSNNNETTQPRKVIKGRRLFREMSGTPERLIEPFNHGDSSISLPKIVQNGLKPNKKRPSWILDSKKEKSKSPTKNEPVDIRLPRKLSTSIRKKTNTKDNSFKETLIQSISPIKPATPIISRRPLSPLVTNKSSPKIEFVTPKNNRKRNSLRTHVLKRSVKKKQNESLVESSSSESSILPVPETEKINKNSRQLISDQHRYDTILETPLPPRNEQTRGTCVTGDSLTDSVIGGMIESPQNVSRYLDSVLPNRKKPASYDHILFIPKSSYDHCTAACPPNFSEQQSHVTEKISQPTTSASNIVTFSDKIPSLERQSQPSSRSSTRRSARLSGRIVIPDQIDNIEPRQSSADSIFEFNSQSTPSPANVPIKNTKSTTPATNNITYFHNIPPLERQSQPVFQSSTRRSARLSGRIVIPDPNDNIEPRQSSADTIFKPDEQSTPSPVSVSIKNTESIINSSKSDITSASEIFKPDPSSQSVDYVRKSTRLSGGAPPVNPPNEISNNRKRTWSQRVQPIINKPNRKMPVKTNKKPKIDRGSIDSPSNFIFSPYPPIKNKRSKKLSDNSINYEIVLVGFSNEAEKNVKSMSKKLPTKYHFVEMVRSKEQIIIVSDKPKRTINLIKGFVFGNTFVSINWIHESVQSKEWLSFSSFTVKDSDLADIPVVPSKENSSLFSEYSAMYISTTSSTQKYKLRIIIEMAGGKVTDSFRQAGVVINTRKVNALSVNEFWILDSVKEGKALNPNRYLIL